MGKYIRKSSSRGGGTGTAAPAVVVAGVRTRSRAAATADAPAPKRPRKAAPTCAEVDAEGCCYLQLRSRRLFMAVASPRETATLAGTEEEDGAALGHAVPLGVITASAASVEAVAAGDSRCSSTASSVDATVLIVRNHHAAEQVREREDCGRGESSVSDSGCVRECREATPSSRAPGDHSDQESSKKAADDDDDPKRHRRRPFSAATTTTAASCRRITTMPQAEEIEEFFAAAEKAEAERFAAKYNFDVARGVPLGGRFEWTPVASG